MIGNHPHRMVLVFHHRADTGAYQSTGHIEQIDQTSFLVIDADTRRRALPDKAARIFHHTNRIACIHRHVGVIWNQPVSYLARNRVHKAVVPGSAHHQPAFLNPPDGGHIVARNLGILRIPGLELTRFRMQHLDASTQCTHPYPMPFVLRNAPDAIGRQALGVTRSAIVDDGGMLRVRCRRDAVYQSAIVGAEPHAAVTGTVAAYHDVTHHRTVGCRIMTHLFVCLRIIHNDAVLVAAYPVVAQFVLTHRIDVAHLQTTDTGKSLHILVDTVFIRAYPDISVVVLVDVSQGIVADGRFVSLAIGKLFPLPVLQVNDYQSLMVGSYPYPPSGVNLDIPYLQIVRRVGNSLGLEIFDSRVVPAILVPYIDKRAALCDGPDIPPVIYKQLILLVVQASMFAHPLVLPLHASLLAHTDDLTVVGRGNDVVSVVSHPRDAIGRVKLEQAIAHLDLRNLLGMRIITVDALLVELHPKVLLVVNIHILHSCIETEKAFKLTAGISLHFLCYRVIDAIVHALFQPQLTVIGLHNLVGIVVAHRRGVALVRIEHFNAVTIIAVQTIGRSYPYETLGVPKDAVHLRVRQAVAGVQSPELHLRNICLGYKWP